MRPICFKCEATSRIPVTEMFRSIADVSKWTTFTGYGPLPGVKSASYRTRTDTMVGSVIHVQNTDGSQHDEEITEWIPGEAITMRFTNFSPPLSKLATHFTEHWTFRVTPDHSRISRQLKLYPKSAFARPALWFISKLLKPGIARHLNIITRTPPPGQTG